MEIRELLQIQTRFQHEQKEIVKAFGAVLVSPFTQAREPMLSFCKRYDNTSRGICEALVARWIADHANDRSIWDAMLVSASRGGVPTYDIRISVINEIVTQQHLGTFGGTSQRAHTAQYLKTQHVIPRVTIVGGHEQSTPAIEWVGDAHAIGRRMNAMLDGDRNHAAGFYAMLAVKSAKAGHVMGAFIGSRNSDVAFFDPNFGDFWFEKRASFRTFLPQFLQRNYSEYRGLDIRTFGKLASAFKGAA